MIRHYFPDENIYKHTVFIWLHGFSVLPHHGRLCHLGTNSVVLRRLKLDPVMFHNIILNNTDVIESLSDILNPRVLYI